MKDLIIIILLLACLISKKQIIEVICWFFPKEKRLSVKLNLRGMRASRYIRKKAKFVGERVHCSGEKVTINKNTIIKDNACFSNLKVLGNGNFTIGKRTVIGEDLMVITANHNYTGKKLPFDETFVYKDVEIGDYCWLGVRVTLCPGAKIGEGSIIQAGAVVHGEIPPLSIAGGNPAKVFKQRDKEHYYKLKEKQG